MFKTAGSQVHLWTPGLPVIMCSVLKLHYLNSLLTLHKSSGQSMCQPVNRLCTFNWTWQNIHSSELYIIIWCQTMKQIPTVFTNSFFAFTKDCFPYWLIQAANSLVYATLLKKNKSITSRAISWSLIHWQLASFIQCYIKQCIGR